MPGWPQRKPVRHFLENALSCENQGTMMHWKIGIWRAQITSTPFVGRFSDPADQVTKPARLDEWNNVGRIRRERPACRSAPPPELARSVEWVTGVFGGDEPYSIQPGIPSRQVGAAARMERHTGRSLRNGRIMRRSIHRQITISRDAHDQIIQLITMVTPASTGWWSR